MNHCALMATLLTAGALTTSLPSAEPPKQIPLTAEELAKHLGIDHQRWRLTFDEPVLATMWISETLAGKTTTLAKAEIKEPSKHVTYEVMVERKTENEYSGFDIGIDLAGDNESEGETYSSLRPRYLSASWGFKQQHPFNDKVPLDKDVVLFSWEQKLKAGHALKAEGNDEGLPRVVEVKIRFFKPSAPNGSPSPAP